MKRFIVVRDSFDHKGVEIAEEIVPTSSIVKVYKHHTGGEGNEREWVLAYVFEDRCKPNINNGIIEFREQFPSKGARDRKFQEVLRVLNGKC